MTVLMNRYRANAYRENPYKYLEVAIERQEAREKTALAQAAAKAVAKAAAARPKPRATAVNLDDGPSAYAHLDAPHPFPRSRARVAPQPVEPAFRRRGREFAESMEFAAAQAEGRKPRDLIRGPVQGVTKVTGADLLRVLEDENARKRDRQ